MEHPLRLEILGVLWDGPTSPTRIQRRLENVSLNLVSHHIKVLKELGYIELVETVKKRGAIEHVYRIAGSLIVGDEEWEQLTPKVRQPLTAATLRMISKDLERSLLTGKFTELSTAHLSRTPLRLDREGQSEVTDILTRALNEVLEARARSLKRLEAGSEESLPTTVAIMHFPTALP